MKAKNDLKNLVTKAFSEDLGEDVNVVLFSPERIELKYRNVTHVYIENNSLDIYNAIIKECPQFKGMTI